MGVVATLLPPHQLQRCRAALRDRYEVVACDDWNAVLRACERQPVRVAVVDIFLDPEPFDRLRQLKQRLPRLAVIAYVTVTVERAPDLFDAGRQGVDALIITDRNDSAVELIRTVATAESRNLSDGVRRQLSGVDSVVYDAVMLAVTQAHERLSPTGLARRLGLPRRTVLQRLSAAGFPAPLRLLTWGRLIAAAHMLEDAHRSADRVASTLAFPSGSAFRNTCQRYLHATPRQIRARGGAQYVIRCFFRQVRSARTPETPQHARAGRLALAV
jgi:AraC-like DNA-binding protein